MAGRAAFCGRSGRVLRPVGQGPAAGRAGSCGRSGSILWPVGQGPVAGRAGSCGWSGSVLRPVGHPLRPVSHCLQRCPLMLEAKWYLCQRCSWRGRWCMPQAETGRPRSPGGRATVGKDYCEARLVVTCRQCRRPSGSLAPLSRRPCWPPLPPRH